jgi:predicted nucleic acid-binding protein
MKLLIDTNIILDILLARTPFVQHAEKLVRMIMKGQVQAYLTANSIADIVYIARKTRSLREIELEIIDLLDWIDVIGVDRDDIIEAFNLGFNDFEDALQSACSEKEQIEYIVTRNKKDFSRSNVVVVDIADFLDEHYK